jgi:phosphoglycerate kinase
LRFYPGEEANDSKFAKMLAGLADVYVNDAFAVCHRKAASTVAITKFLPSYAGLNLLDEVKFLSQALKPKKPAIAIVGGVKLDSKFGVVKNFLKKYDKILTGGGVANLLLEALGFKIGGSITDEKFAAAAKTLCRNKKVVVPSDFMVADAETKNKIHYTRAVWNRQIADKHEMILDIGTDTAKLFADEIEKAKTIVWAGPMGKTDDRRFSGGSEFIARLIGARSRNRTVMSVVGGGETISVVNRVKGGEAISFISTGGGAMLEFLEGKVLPGIKPLIKK